MHACTSAVRLFADLTVHVCNLNLSYEITWFFYALFPELWALCLAVRFVFQYTATRFLLLIFGGNLLTCPKLIRQFTIEPKDVAEWWKRLFDDTLSIFMYDAQIF